MDNDVALLRHLYEYDPATGEFLMKNYAEGGKGRKRRIGEAVGSVDKRDGTRIIRFQGKWQRASRLAWLYAYGDWPSRQVVYEDPSLPLPARDRLSNLKLAGEREELTAESLRRLLNYDSDTGEFTWRYARKGVRAGDPVGGSRGAHGMLGHKYIRINQIDYAAQRIAWLYVYGEWPKARIVFKDGDPLNIRIDNLVEGAFEHGTRQNPVLTEEVRRQRQAATYRRADLKRSFGLSIEQYQELHDAQGGVCAICGEAETKERNGRVKWLAVDHDHETGEVRALLCQNCNHMIGHSRERPELLEAGAAYLRRHEKKDEVA